MLLISLWAALVYANSFDVGFRLDDYHVILNSDRIRGFQYFGHLSRWTRLLFNRQLAQLSFALNYHLHGYDLWGYHLFNLGVHTAASLSAYWLMRWIHGLPEVRRSISGKPWPFAALAGGLIFAAHPVQTQAVTYLTQRMAAMAALFYLVAVCFYAQARHAHIRGHGHGRILLFYTGTALCLVLGMLCKATILSLPMALLLFEICFVRDVRGRIQRRFVAVFAAGLPILAGLFAWIRGPVHMAGAPPHLIYAFTELRVLVTYLRLLILPVDQMVLYDFPLSRSILEMRTLASLGLLLSLGAMALWAFRRYRLLAFGMLWIFVTLAVECTIVPMKYVIFEYRLYLPMLGYAVLLPAVITYGRRKPTRNVAGAGLVGIVLALSGLTVQQNNLWRDGIALWRSNVEKAPRNSEARHNLGFHCFMEGRYARALEHFTRAVELDSTNFKAVNQRGLCHQLLGNRPSALEDFNRAVRLNHRATDALHNRASLLQAMGRWTEAAADLRRIVTLRPRARAAWVDLGALHDHLGEWAQALHAFDRALELGEESARLYIQRGNAHLALGNTAMAAGDYARAVELDARDKGAWGNLGVARTRMGRFDAAVTAFDRAIALDAGFADAYFNRAVALRHLGRSAQALADLERCLRIDPRHLRAAGLRRELLSETAGSSARQVR